MDPGQFDSLLNSIFHKLGQDGENPPRAAAPMAESLLGPLLEGLLKRADGGQPGGGGNGGGTGGSGPADGQFPALGPSHLLVVLGLLSGVLEVISVLIDKNQAVQIILSGSLKRKTPADKALDGVGSLTFDQIFTAVFNRFGL